MPPGQQRFIHRVLASLHLAGLLFNDITQRINKRLAVKQIRHRDPFAGHRSPKLLLIFQFETFQLTELRRGQRISLLDFAQLSGGIRQRLLGKFT